jgi:hypothetical protein
MGLRKGQKNKGTFKKGEVRNPTGENGRKKDAREFHVVLDSYLHDLASLKDDGEKRERYLWLVEVLWRQAMAGNAAYMRELLDRWLGKSKERLEVTGADGKPINASIVILPPNPLDVIK